jgi:hypothetical protein
MKIYYWIQIGISVVLAIGLIVRWQRRRNKK